METDWIKLGINKTGVLLENTILDSLVNKHGFGARREEPFSFRTAYGEHFEGTADIFAATKLGGSGVLSLVVECKRADVNRKHWVFEMRKETSFEPLYPFTFFIPTKGIYYSNNLFFPNLGYKRGTDYEKAIQTFEFKDAEKDGKGPNKNNNDNAFKSIRQAYAPLSSLLQSPQLAYNLAHESGRVITYLPIVVTTATLSIMEYSPKDVKRSDGTIELSKIKLLKRDYIYFEYPLPESLRRDGRVDLEKVETERPLKSPIFIVNAEAFDNFITLLMKDIGGFSLGQPTNMT